MMITGFGLLLQCHDLRKPRFGSSSLLSFVFLCLCLVVPILSAIHLSPPPLSGVLIDPHVHVDSPSPIPISPHSGTYPRLATVDASSSLIRRRGRSDTQQEREKGVQIVIAAFDSSCDGYPCLRLSENTDIAHSKWQDLGTVYVSPNQTNDLGNSFPVVIDDAHIYVACRNHIRESDVSGSPLKYLKYRLWLFQYTSGDDSWLHLSTIDESVEFGLWEPFILVRENLDWDLFVLQAFYAKERAGGFQDIVMRESKDEGRTWSENPIIVSSSKGSREGMPSTILVATESGSERLLSVFEGFIDSEWGHFGVFWRLSLDSAGTQWGERNVLYVTEESRADAGAPYVISVGKYAVASFMTNEDDTPGKKVWPNGASMKVVVGEVVMSPVLTLHWWTRSRTIVQTESAWWPSLAPLFAPDSLLMACGYESQVQYRLGDLTNTTKL